MRRVGGGRMLGAGARGLGFLCGANSAAWLGDSWIVAIGGEADGVLVRMTPPRGR